MAAALLIRADEQDVETLAAVPRRDLHARDRGAEEGRFGGRRNRRFVGLVDQTGVPGRRRCFRVAAGVAALIDEDAATQGVLGEQVVAGHDDVGAGHDQHDGR